MKITLDTNILISATFWYGDSFEILERVEQKDFELILSKEILQEYTEVLDYKEIKEKILSKHLDFRKTVEKIISISTIVEPFQKVTAVIDDPDDNMILECAQAGDVDYIITKDLDLLRLNIFEGIRIVHPQEFLHLVKEKKAE